MHITLTVDRSIRLVWLMGHPGATGASRSFGRNA
jgi:hypothetical protein